MKELIEQIIDIEERAERIVQRAVLSRERVGEEVEEYRLKRSAELREDEQRRLGKIADFCRMEEEEERAAIVARYEKAVERLEAVFAENKDMWVERIFNDILS